MHPFSGMRYPLLGYKSGLNFVKAETLSLWR